MGAVLVVAVLLVAMERAGTEVASARRGENTSEGAFRPPVAIRSEVLGEERTVRVWLPPSYGADGGRRFPVLYLHDGQNKLSSAGPHVAFGWGNWEVDRAVEKLAAQARMEEVILVAVDNTRRRYQEYRGRAAEYTGDELAEMRSRVPDAGDNRAYEKYARFLIDELKPWVDAEYRTKPAPEHTGVMGSSMGGIASLALAWDHPGVFGKAASVSGAFGVEKRAFLERGLKRYQSPPKPVRVYLDSGVVSTGGDDGRAGTDAVAAELRRIGWEDGEDLLHFTDEPPLTAEQLEPFGLPDDKLAEAQVSQHNELYWRLRVWRPLEFLFPAGG